MLYNPLKFNDLTKPGREIRSIRIAQKINNQEPFSLVDGSIKILEFIDSSYYNLFLNNKFKELKEISNKHPNTYAFFRDKTGNPIGINDLLKTHEFGGKGKGFGTRVEDEHLLLTRHELENIIKENNNQPITLIVGGNVYKNIMYVETQKGFPKADFNFLDLNKKPIVFISHKKAGSPASAKDFVRWSGYNHFQNHPEVKLFLNNIKKHLENNQLDSLQPKMSFAHQIKDINLIQGLVYGKDFGQEFGPDNVNIIIQGKLIFEKISDGIYNLKGEHFLLNGQIPKLDYYPYLSAHYRSDRRMFGIECLEAIAMTKHQIYSRKNPYLLKNNRFVKAKKHII